jgi:ribosomal protein S18 acetylase RimI-like enzyme
VPHDQLLSVPDDWCTRIAALPAHAIAMTKPLLRAAAHAPWDHALAAVELWRYVGLTRPWNDPVADLRRAVAAPASTVLAGLHGALLATAIVGHDGHRGWVYYVAVRPDARDNGCGREMMRACEARLTRAFSGRRARGIVNRFMDDHDELVRQLAS